MNNVWKAEMREINRETNRVIASYPHDENSATRLEWQFARAIRALHGELSGFKGAFEDQEVVGAFRNLQKWTNDPDAYPLVSGAIPVVVRALERAIPAFRSLNDNILETVPPTEGPYSE